MPESNACSIFAPVIWTRRWRNLNAAGIAVEPDPEPYPNGRFARLYDPEGIAIELWQPAGRDAR
jgi:predicted enzyme related to lactoylglutathione lyase